MVDHIHNHDQWFTNSLIILQCLSTIDTGDVIVYKPCVTGDAPFIDIYTIHMGYITMWCPPAIVCVLINPMNTILIL